MNRRIAIETAIALLIPVLLIVLNMTVYLPSRARLVALEEEVAHVEQELVDVARRQGDFQLAADLLPRPLAAHEAGDQRFLGQVGDELRRLGLDLEKYEPLRERPAGDYAERQYRFDIEGSYSRFVRFLEYLETMPELVVIESFDFRSRLVTPGNRHKMTLTLKVIGY
jgi:hypothetical protein